MKKHALSHFAHIKLLFLCVVVIVLLLISCTKKTEVIPMSTQDANLETSSKTPEVTKIDAKTAKTMMDTESNYIILDVRTQQEYDEGHIEGAVLLPNDQVGKLAAQMLPNKDQMILVYCRSGNRSGLASAELVSMGYSGIYDFGGIIDWPYDVVK